MAIYHCHCKIVSRGSGRSAVGAAAYRSGEKLTNEYDGLEHDYTRKGGVAYSEIMLCENAPKEYQDRSTLWNEVEKIEKSSKAQLAREYEVALPVELTREEQIKLVRDFAKENFTDKGMCVDFSIHDKEDGNPHAHIMLTIRPIEQDGTWGTKQKKEYILDKDGNKQYDKKKQTYKCKTIKTTDWDSTEFLQRNRESWAGKVNEELEKKNLPQRVDHRSFKEQGKEQIPTQHIGVSANAMEKRGIESQRGNENREIKEANSELKALSLVERSMQKDIENIKEDISWNKIHEKNAGIEATLPKLEDNEKALRALQQNLKLGIETAKNMKPTKTSEGRTVEYDLRQIPYFEYHKNKVIGDISFMQSKVNNYLEALEQKRQEQTIAKEQPKPQEQGGFAARREALMKQEAPQEKPQIDVAYTEKMAKELASLRNEFVRETVQSAERTNYQPNPIYARQANEIESISKTVSDQTRTIEAFKAERDKLGVFKGKEKKEIQEKIDNFERSRRGNIDKLKALGVADPAQAQEAVKEKRMLAAHEQKQAQAAKMNEGAGSRAEEAKAVFLEMVKQIPADQRQAVLERMGQYKEQPAIGKMSGRMEAFTADAEARRVLDSALKEQGKDRLHDKVKQIERGRAD
ncbi:MobQ family relaxase [Anaeromicropila populeti]|uniref:MobA/MobL family protein n=1 Tax=Anaeromicropila populeti TaxID=37658 RepID=A0A1I6M1S0_9FIRM|nr:MobQ family relaxase [Anaeromicropila populeti]SFS09667.1 MobA/MobL family protein [Anaeromicropila populeti]